MLSLKNPTPLFKAADETRLKYKGSAVFLRALIEISNICEKNCLYCGLRNADKTLKRYAMSADEIIKTASFAAKQGFKTVVLQSGEISGGFFINKNLPFVIRQIKKFGIAVTLSLGGLSPDVLKRLKLSGADRYLIRAETTSKGLFKEMHPDTSFAERISAIKTVKKLGYELGTGVLVGLPRQTIKSLARDILFFKKVKADMVGIGPFIPSPSTPLAKAKKGNIGLTLKVIAITRLLLPNANMPATTAMETLQKNGRMLALTAGANVVMPNVTPAKYKKLYALYPGKASLGAYKAAQKELKKIGRTAN